MNATSNGAAKPIGGSPSLLIAGLAMLFHGAAQSALPSATEEAPAVTPVPAETKAKQTDDVPIDSWSLPPIRFGGSVSFSGRRDSFDGVSNVHSGQMTTLNASTNTYIWQPWFAQLNATLGFSKSTDDSEYGATTSSGGNVMVTGSGQLSLLPQSKYPFEAHFERNDNRVSSNLAMANGYTSQRYGFTQRHYRPQGDAVFGWDRSLQTSADSGVDLQDSLQLQISHRLESHQLQFNGTRNTNRREKTSEQATQENFSVQDSYDPNPSISVVSMANVSSTDLNLQQGANTTRVSQFSSNMFWRPADQRMTVNGGARVIAFESGSTGFSTLGEFSGSRSIAFNANAGVNYDYSQFIRLNAALNVSQFENQGFKSNQTMETLGASYQPEDIDLGVARYNWGISGNASNRHGSDGSEQSLVLQISHRLSRSFTLEGGSTISMDASQSLSAVANKGGEERATQTPTTLAATKQLTQSGSISWDLSRQTGAALIRFSVSDSRALDGNQDYFQLVNIQASSSLPTSGYSLWNGNLTIQSVRQGRNVVDQNSAPDGSVVTSASGSLGFQTQRFFGVRNLRFGSDLRLNTQSQQAQQAQQSLLESRANQEAAAWTNWIDYSIGRTQLRVSAMVSRNSANVPNADPVTGVTNSQDAEKINRSVNFTLSRNFGMF